MLFAKICCENFLNLTLLLVNPVLLNIYSPAQRLPDGSGKPGEGFVLWLVPDLQRTAGTVAEKRTER